MKTYSTKLCFSLAILPILGRKKYLENFNFDFLFGNCSLKYKEEIKKKIYIFIFKVPGINKSENFSTRALLARAAKFAGFLEFNS